MPNVHFEYPVNDTARAHITSPRDFEVLGCLARCEDAEGDVFGMIQPPEKM